MEWCEKIKAEPRIQKLQTNAPIVLTYDNSLDHPGLLNYIQTLQKNQWMYKVIGQGEVWKGFQNKIVGYKNYLKTLDENQLVVVTDARDVFCLRSPLFFKEAINSICSLESQILVSLEMFAEGYTKFDPNKNYSQVSDLTSYFKHHHLNPETFYVERKFVNSGLIAGKAKNLVLFFEFACSYSDDQKALGDYMCLHPERVIADIDALIIHTSSFAVNGCSFHKDQSKDSPTLADLLSKGRFFLHIPGLIVCKGQKCVYDLLNNWFNTFSSRALLDVYDEIYNQREFYTGKYKNL